ncbi:hypothetical protein HMPREF0591_5928 [Mycobacterium parascrofulaceum ATCC BAA-614]|uniref:Uncharacterized protein n=1 Tax=Mycobacterium parascrofulaceum ATCC BAA-614 TaxID=525368 RepID=D5PID4_9MYCO|nr:MULTISPECIES: hypothetical protein [Mycobacterium]EFG74147.1 hypothetical protein HMPREF0591_5928 [Mycobacterium parascrofulaceum ATCC BAA-614]
MTRVCESIVACALAAAPVVERYTAVDDDEIRAAMMSALTE